MFMTLCKAIQAFVDNHSTTLPRDNVTSMLAVMANLCRVLINAPCVLRSAFSNKCAICFFFSSVKCPFRERSTIMFCLRVMTGSIILFDHIDPEGAFVKCSPIDVRYCDRKSISNANSCRFVQRHKHCIRTLSEVAPMIRMRRAKRTPWQLTTSVPTWATRKQGSSAFSARCAMPPNTTTIREHRRARRRC